MKSENEFDKFSCGELRVAFNNRVYDRNRALAHVATLHKWIEVTDVLGDRSRKRVLTVDEQHAMTNLEEFRVYPSSLPKERCPDDRAEVIKGLKHLSLELKDLLNELSRLMPRFHHNLDEGQRRIAATGEL